MTTSPTRPRAFDAVISDIDGCIGPESAAPMDAHALVRIAEYNAAAQLRLDRPVVTLCSGRPQPYVEALCRVIGNATLPVVCEMGVWLYDPQANAFLIDPTIDGEDRRMLREASAWIEETMVPDGFVIQPGKTASISLWHKDTPRLKAHMPRLREVVGERGWTFRVSDTVAWINIELEHVGKGTGIERLCAMKALRKERLAGIGDTKGDMAIRERVAYFACPANADDALKAVANYVSPHKEIEGVLDILDRLKNHAPS